MLTDSEAIIKQALESAYKMVNILFLKRNWLLGKRNTEEELKGKPRAEYGKRVIPCLAERLSAKYRHGFDRTNLYYYLDFTKVNPTLFDVGNLTYTRHCNLMPRFRCPGHIIEYCSIWGQII